MAMRHLDAARIEELRDIDGGKLLNFIFNHLVSDIDKLHKEISKISPDRDREAIGFLAHSILGAALQAGAPLLAQAARALEAAARAPEHLSEAIEQIVVTGRKTRQEILEYLANTDI